MSWMAPLFMSTEWECMLKVHRIWDLGISSVQCEKEVKGFHWNRDRQHYGGKHETGGITPLSRCVMCGQQDIILMLIRRCCSWRRRRLKALRFVSPVSLNLILTPSW